MNAESMRQALRLAFNLGQTYWQQADSDYPSQHKKSDETQQKFEQLIKDTLAADGVSPTAANAQPGELPPLPEPYGYHQPSSWVIGHGNIPVYTADQKQAYARAALKPVNVAGMVNRFLGWKLPKDFVPDCGISFDGRKDDQWNKNKTWPIGTNLLSAAQAKAMFEYCLQGDAQSDSAGDARDAALVEAAKKAKLQLKLWMRDHGQDIASQDAIKAIDAAIAASAAKGEQA